MVFGSETQNNTTMIIYSEYKAKEESNKNTLKIFYEDCPENPIIDWGLDNFNFYFCHKNYSLSKESYNFTDREKMISRMAYDLLPDSVLNWKWVSEALEHYAYYDYFSDEEEEKLLNLFYKHAIILPVYMYDHSGITLNTTGFSCGWDSGEVGYIAVTKREAKKQFKKYEKAIDYLNGIVKLIDDYVTGNVFCFSIEDENGNVIDSCGGFYGSDFEENGLFEYTNITEWEEK